MIAPVPRAIMTSWSTDQPPDSRPRAERTSTHLAVLRLAGERERRQAAQEPEPDAEDLGVGAPLLAAEVGHPGEGHERVRDEEQAERTAAVDARDELEPDDDREARQRPATSPTASGTRSTPPPLAPKRPASHDRNRWIVVNGSIHAQAGPISALISATPTQP